MLPITSYCVLLAPFMSPEFILPGLLFISLSYSMHQHLVNKVHEIRRNKVMLKILKHCKKITIKYDVVLSQLGISEWLF